MKAHEEELRRDLARRLAAGQEDVILLALHISSGAHALGLQGPIEPLSEEVSDRSDS